MWSGHLAKGKAMRVSPSFLCVVSQVSGRLVGHLQLFRQEAGRHLGVLAGLLEIFDRALQELDLQIDFLTIRSRNFALEAAQSSDHLLDVLLDGLEANLQLFLCHFFLRSGISGCRSGAECDLRLRGFAIESGECNERVTLRQENIM
jgi:hypothetical protein